MFEGPDSNEEFMIYDTDLVFLNKVNQILRDLQQIHAQIPWSSMQLLGLCRKEHFISFYVEKGLYRIMAYDLLKEDALRSYGNDLLSFPKESPFGLGIELIFDSGMTQNESNKEDVGWYLSEVDNSLNGRLIDNHITLGSND